MSTVRLLFKEKVLYIIILLLGFQQFPIIRLGGSLKMYEILGFILLFYNLLHFKTRHRTDKVSLLSFLFFVVIPVISYIYSSVFFEYPYDYYATFPKGGEGFKSSYYIFPLLQVFYMLMNWQVFKGLTNARDLYDNIFMLMKIAIIYGTIISLYSLCALYVIDFVPMLPSWIQFKFTKEGNRSTGLSMEPGTYVLYQIWIVLFLWYSKRSFTKRWWYILFVINVISCVLTQSTALWGFIVAIILSFFIFNTSVSTRRNGLIAIIISVVVIYSIVSFLGYQDTFYYYFFKKVQSFVVQHGHKALDSGEIRKYMSDIGYEIFKHYPFLGVGYGRSMYYMYLYKRSVGISVSGEAVNYGTTPLNMFSIISAEMGIMGLLAFSLFYLIILRFFWKHRNKSPLHKMFLTGCITEFFTFFSLYTPHAVFLWAYLGLGIGYIKYFDRKKLAEQKREQQKILTPHTEPI